MLHDARGREIRGVSQTSSGCQAPHRLFCTCPAAEEALSLGLKASWCLAQEYLGLKIGIFFLILHAHPERGSERDIGSIWLWMCRWVL